MPRLFTLLLKHCARFACLITPLPPHPNVHSDRLEREYFVTGLDSGGFSFNKVRWRGSSTELQISTTASLGKIAYIVLVRTGVLMGNMG